MLSHNNLTANLGAFSVFDREFQISDEDRYISYLPLSHIYERYLMLLCFCNQVAYGFYQGEVAKLREDLALLKPTIMGSVPRLLNRFHDMIKAMIQSQTAVPMATVEQGIAKKLRNVGNYTDVYYDKLIFDKFKAILGGHVRMIIIGSAPVAEQVVDFLKACFSCPIIQGYGQTETSAPATLSWVYDPDSSHVGPPMPSCEIKLIDVPEMGYFSTDTDYYGNPQPRGEILVRGCNCFHRYFNNKDQTDETIVDGWVRTGDIGELLPLGRLKIVDRKKSMFKLS
mmetsp:Transcript_49051/g.36115  ORF Transcript_49051/g.36115 Transcript_49051/m.36115 type:complete len:283 (-) Transcript_49051:459-1307(-)